MEGVVDEVMENETIVSLVGIFRFGFCLDGRRGCGGCEGCEGLKGVRGEEN